MREIGSAKRSYSEKSKFSASDPASVGSGLQDMTNYCEPPTSKTLVLNHLKDITGPLLDPLQFAYWAKRSVDNKVNMELHFILQHLDSPGIYTQILFVDFSLVFNIIIKISSPSSTCWPTSASGFTTSCGQDTAGEAGKNLLQQPYQHHWHSLQVCFSLASILPLHL